MKPSLTVIFITMNEEYHIGAAIDNIKDIANEIWVVDSGSTDKTVEIAESKGAKVIYHKFENFGAQWNFALSLPIKSAWTMKMDPDERLSTELKNEILFTLNLVDISIKGFSFDRVLWFLGKRLDGVKNNVVRIWRTGCCRFSDVVVNEHPLIQGKIIKLKGLMEHLDSKNLSHWLEKQNKYTSGEASMRYRNDELSVSPKLFGTNLERRMWFKRYFYKLPCRYQIWFLYCFFVRGAWRSGRTGWAWAQMRVMVMRLVEYKWIESSNARR